jgi:nucleoid-associated protein YgaU
MAKRIPVSVALLCLATGCGGGTATRPDAAGARPPETPAASAPAIPLGAREYLIKSGDSLWTISEMHYGSGMHWEQIENANRGVLTRTDLKVGQKIVIPEIPGVPFRPLQSTANSPAHKNPPAPTAPETPPATSGDSPDGRKEAGPGTAKRCVLHQVKEGDSLWSIADDHYGDGTRWKNIEEANRETLQNGLLKLGMKLVIPEIPGVPFRPQ